jgi:peptidoglycan DL-endopeptidase CwlO
MHRSSSRVRRAVVAAALAGATLGASALPAVAASGSRQTVRDQLAVNAEEALFTLQMLRVAEHFDGTPEAIAEARANYEREATEVATDVVARAGGQVADYLGAWTAADDTRMTAVFTGLAQVGDPYRRRSIGPDAFDCSGLTSFAWAAAGVTLPRNSTMQIRTTGGTSDSSSLEPGDLVWRPGHIMMYLGADDAVVHAPQSGRNVEVRSWGRAVRFGDPLG